MVLFASWVGIAVHLVLPTAAVLSTVALDYGTFTGRTNTTTGITSFLGMRYADAPLGQLRWQPPVSPPSKKVGSVKATAFGFACIGTTQTGSGATTSEDCLFGNVFIPAGTTATSALPVLVFFHGGGFESGRTSKYSPENLLLSSTAPLIFASFEYRLGQFGFLGGTPVRNNGTLNVGLLDQKAALQWVQRYIGSFGGDPTRVTIMGQSAGAGSIIYHMIGNGGQNSNLFHQAIADSPPLLALLDYTDAVIENLFTQFAGLANCGNKATGAATMACLRAASTNTLATAGSKTLKALTSSLYPFGPIADGTFIQQRPVDALSSGNFVHVPVLFGSNTDEGANWSAKLPDPNANTSSPQATQTTVYNFLAGQYPTLTTQSFQTAVAQYYPLSDYGGSFSLQGQQMYGEMRFICPAIMISGTVADAGLSAYQYHWDNPTLGSTHGDELVTFFPGTQVFDPPNQALAIAMRGYWTSFVTSGAPVASNSIAWPPAANSDGSPRMLLHPGGIAVEEVDDALSQRCAFWRGLASELDT
ncbi:Alpha/Beta hydrolase protein [Mycena filopes]|nr:Alpha/Beta hydrolase protein [Mycena filopes]